MGSIAQINHENVPQPAGRHQNTQEIHLQRLLGDGQRNYSVLLFSRVAFFPSRCLETGAQRAQEEPPLADPAPRNSKTSSLWMRAKREKRPEDVQHAEEHRALG